jgi:hypothetical protein
MLAYTLNQKSGIKISYLRITLNKRLETAAAAIVQRIISRNSPLVLRPVSPFRKGSTGLAADISEPVNEK